MKKTTIEDIENMSGMMITPKQAADVMGCSAKSLKQQLIKNPDFFGFRAVIIHYENSSYIKVQIPKIPFINFLTFGGYLDNDDTSQV